MLVQHIFHLINASAIDLLDLHLATELLPPYLEHCIVTRERGSLDFFSPFTAIPLGNLYPEDAVHITFSFELAADDANFTFSSDDVYDLLLYTPSKEDSLALKKLISISTE